MHKVLICEDDAILSADLCQIVHDCGHVVCGVFHRSDEALECAAVTKPDFAIVDLKLSNGDFGSADAAALHALGVRIIVLSGYSNVGAGLGCVPHTFAQKPVGKDVIEKLLACREYGG